MTRPQVLIVLALASVLTCAAAPFVGAPPIAVGIVFEQEDADAGHANPDRFILRQIRIPRVALAFLAGASLALCGMAFQSMFRNPLATPFTLGVSSGASLRVEFNDHFTNLDHFELAYALCEDCADAPDCGAMNRARCCGTPRR